MVPLFEPLDEPQATIEVISRIPEVVVYGFLLSSSSHDSVSNFLTERWQDLHHLTGDRFLLVVFTPPASLEDSYKTYWKKRLGASFSRGWQDWKKFTGDGIAYDYLNLFKPGLKPSQLPCLVLFTDPKDRKAIIRTIPADWDIEGLHQLFVGIIETVHECYDVPKEARLEFLRKSLTSPTVRAKAYLAYMADKAMTYMKNNPAKVITTTAGVVLALGTGSILPLAPSAIAVLMEIKNAVK